jgi:hypothetical protein
MCLSLKIKRPADVLSEGQHLGFQWVVIHNGMGYRCGYLRIPTGHPWHGTGTDCSDDTCSADVHGGITFAEADVPCDAPGVDDAWWLGFDCAHAGDQPDFDLPGTHDSYEHLFRYGVVRTQEYVEAECRKLAEQAALAV